MLNKFIVKILKDHKASKIKKTGEPETPELVQETIHHIFIPIRHIYYKLR